MKFHFDLPLPIECSVTTKLCWLASLSWVCVLRLPGLRDQPSLCCGLYTGWVLVFLALRLDTLLQLSARVSSNNNNKQVEAREGDGEGDKELAEKKTD